MSDIYNQNLTELVHCINDLLHAGINLWRYRRFSLAFTFFRTFEAIFPPLI